MLTTDRTKIRNYTSKDFEEVFKMLKDPDVMKYTSFKIPQSKENTKNFLDKWIKESDNPMSSWCVESLESCRPIGWVMLKKGKFPLPEIGFMFSKEYWGKGYASEVGDRILKYGIKELQLKTIFARVHKDNLPSQKVLQKIGMKEVSAIRDIPREENCLYYICE